MACDLLPHPGSESHCIAKTCAQIASMPMNKASDVSAATSSTTARTMTRSSLIGQNENDVLFLFRSQERVVGGAVLGQHLVGQFQLWQSLG